MLRKFRDVGLELKGENGEEFERETRYVLIFDTGWSVWCPDGCKEIIRPSRESDQVAKAFQSHTSPPEAHRRDLPVSKNKANLTMHEIRFLSRSSDRLWRFREMDYPPTTSLVRFFLQTNPGSSRAIKSKQAKQKPFCSTISASHLITSGSSTPAQPRLVLWSRILGPDGTHKSHVPKSNAESGTRFPFHGPRSRIAIISTKKASLSKSATPK